MGLYEWLLSLPKPVQYALALLMLGLSTFMVLNGWNWYWGWIFGFILLWFACFGKRPDSADE